MKAKRMQKGTFLHFLTKKVTFFIFFFAVIYFMHIFAAKIRVRRLQTNVWSSLLLKTVNCTISNKCDFLSQQIYNVFNKYY